MAWGLQWRPWHREQHAEIHSFLFDRKMLRQNSPLASVHLKLLKDTTSTKLIQALRCEELEHGGKSAAKCYQVIAREQDILDVFKELGPTHVQILTKFTSVQLLIHKDAILDFEVGVGEVSNGTRHCHEFLITLYTRHLINQEGNSCNYHPNGCNFHCRIGAIVDLNTKKKQNRSNTCWFQLPKFEDFLLFCFSLSFMKANEESFGFWMFWCTKEAIWRACWLNRADKS